MLNYDIFLVHKIFIERIAKTCFLSLLHLIVNTFKSCDSSILAQQNHIDKLFKGILHLNSKYIVVKFLKLIIYEMHRKNAQFSEFLKIAIHQGEDGRSVVDRIYIGQLDDGKLDGIGFDYSLSNGTVGFGNYENNEISGEYYRTSIAFSNTSKKRHLRIIVGDAEKNAFNGNCICYYDNGLRLKGNFTENLPNGQMKCRNDQRTWVSDYVNGETRK